MGLLFQPLLLFHSLLLAKESRGVAVLAPTFPLALNGIAALSADPCCQAPGSLALRLQVEKSFFTRPWKQGRGESFTITQTTRAGLIWPDVHPPAIPFCHGREILSKRLLLLCSFAGGVEVLSHVGLATAGDLSPSRSGELDWSESGPGSSPENCTLFVKDIRTSPEQTVTHRVQRGVEQAKCLAFLSSVPPAQTEIPGYSVLTFIRTLQMCRGPCSIVCGDNQQM